MVPCPGTSTRRLTHWPNPLALAEIHEILLLAAPGPTTYYIVCYRFVLRECSHISFVGLYIQNECFCWLLNITCYLVVNNDWSISQIIYILICVLYWALILRCEIHLTHWGRLSVEKLESFKIHCHNYIFKIRLHLTVFYIKKNRIFPTIFFVKNRIILVSYIF